MSVWPNLTSSNPALSGSDGILVAVSVPVAPRDLEHALDALANLDFPINPQIYHEAVSVYRFRDGHEESEPTTIVEFPAYESHLPAIRRTLEARGFDPDTLHVADMLENIHSAAWMEPAPAGAPYLTCVRQKYPRNVLAHA